MWKVSIFRRKLNYAENPTKESFDKKNTAWNLLASRNLQVPTSGQGPQENPARIWGRMGIPNHPHGCFVQGEMGSFSAPGLKGTDLLGFSWIPETWGF